MTRYFDEFNVAEIELRDLKTNITWEQEFIQAPTYDEEMEGYEVKSVFYVIDYLLDFMCGCGDFAYQKENPGNARNTLDYKIKNRQ